jgi:formiminoglutamase
MDDIIDYFDPINPEMFIKPGLKQGFYGSALFSRGKPVPLSDARIALIGIAETRNAFPQEYPVSIDRIRNYFYQLSEVSRVKVVDLGNLKPGQQVKDTYASLTHVSSLLIDKGIIPIFIGGSQDITLPILTGVASYTKEPGVALIDSYIDSESEDLHSKSYIHGLLNQYGNKLLVSVIGYQTYNANSEQISFLSDNFIEAVRLGNLRNSFTQTEPILRDADLVSFDLSSIRL